MVSKRDFRRVLRNLVVLKAPKASWWSNFLLWIIKSQFKYFRVSPSHVRLLAKGVRGKRFNLDVWSWGATTSASGSIHGGNSSLLHWYFSIWWPMGCGGLVRWPRQNCQNGTPMRYVSMRPWLRIWWTQAGFWYQFAFWVLDSWHKRQIMWLKVWFIAGGVKRFNICVFPDIGCFEFWETHIERTCRVFNSTPRRFLVLVYFCIFGHLPPPT